MAPAIAAVIVLSPLRAGTGNATRVSPARARRCPADRRVRKQQRPAPDPADGKGPPGAGWARGTRRAGPGRWPRSDRAGHAGAKASCLPVRQPTRPAPFSARAKNMQKDPVSLNGIFAKPVAGCRGMRTRESPCRLCLPGAVPIGAMDTGSRRKMYGLTVGGPFPRGDGRRAAILGWTRPARRPAPPPGPRSQGLPCEGRPDRVEKACVRPDMQAGFWRLS